MIKNHIRNRFLKHYSYCPDTGAFFNLRKNRPVPVRYGQYTFLCFDGRTIMGSRAAYLVMTGRWGDVIDHINELKHDDRWRNLRNVTRSDNARFARDNRSRRSRVERVGRLFELILNGDFAVKYTSETLFTMFNNRLVWGGMIVPKPPDGRPDGFKGPAREGKWMIMLDTVDGDEPLRTQLGRVRGFGSADTAMKFLYETIGQTEFTVQIDYGI